MLAFDMKIYAVVYANAFFGLIMCVLNAYCVKKYSGYKQEYKRTFVVPGVASVLMGVVIFLNYKLWMYIFRVNALATIVNILVGVIVYAALLFLLKGLTEEEILKLPKGRTIVRFAKKMHLLR